MNNPQIYIPTKLRNKDQIDKIELVYMQKNQKYNNKKEEHNNLKNVILFHIKLYSIFLYIKNY